jgi:membrane associated rhomboid family serine protease
MDTQDEQRIPFDPVFTYVLITVNVIVFLIGSGHQQQFSLWGATNRYFILEAGEYYRLVSAMFLHADFLHLIFNMLALYAVGRALEGFIGHTPFLLIYFLGGLAGSVASVLLNDPNVSSVGASGAVFGLFGAALVYDTRYRTILDPDAQKGMKRSAQLIVINFFNGFRPGSNVDNWAHLGGLLGGIVVALLLGTLFTIRQHATLPGLLLLVNERRRPLRILFVAAALLVLALSMTAFSISAPRTLTLDNITVPVLAGWHTLIEFENDPGCQQGGMKCLAVLVSPSGVFYELDRFSGLDIVLIPLEQFDQLAAESIEAEGGALLSRSEVEISGIAAIERVYQFEAVNRMFVFLKHEGSIVRVYVEANPDTFRLQNAEIDLFVETIQIALD